MDADGGRERGKRKGRRWYLLELEVEREERKGLAEKRRDLVPCSLWYPRTALLSNWHWAGGTAASYR